MFLSPARVAPEKRYHRPPAVARQLRCVQGEYEMPCEHEQRRWTRRVVANGAVQFVEQCLNCGASMNQPLGHLAARQRFGDSELPAFDEALKDKYTARLIASADADWAAKKATFDADYAKYLRSGAWAKKRRLVLERCGGLCEGCGSDNATEVHHLTYEHVQNEFLWELVGVCKDCHDRVHEEPSPR